MTDPSRDDGSDPYGPWSPAAPQSARPARSRPDWGTPAQRSTRQPIVVDADNPDDPQRFSPRPASKSATGAFVISDVARQDIFRPSLEPGPRRRFTGSPVHQPEITGTPWRPELHQPAMSAPGRRRAGSRNRSEPTGETHPAVLDAAVGVAPS